jgi:hypothetical protein
MAVPIVTSLKVVCDHSPTLGMIGTFLRDDSKATVTRNIARVRQTPVQSTSSL